MLLAAVAGWRASSTCRQFNVVRVWRCTQQDLQRSHMPALALPYLRDARALGHAVESLQLVASVLHRRASAPGGPQKHALAPDA